MESVLGGEADSYRLRRNDAIHPERTLAQGELTTTSASFGEVDAGSPTKRHTPFLGWRPPASNRISHSGVLREPHSAGTFKKSAPRPSAIVGCAIIASRKPM